MDCGAMVIFCRFVINWISSYSEWALCFIMETDTLVIESGLKCTFSFTARCLFKYHMPWCSFFLFGCLCQCIFFFKFVYTSIIFLDNTDHAKWFFFLHNLMFSLTIWSSFRSITTCLIIWAWSGYCQRTKAVFIWFILCCVCSQSMTYPEHWY